MSISRSTLVVLSLALPLLPAIIHPNLAEGQTGAGHGRSAFIEQVRQATEVFRDVRNAAPDYQPALGCVSGPLVGAMGVHYVNGSLLDDTVQIDKPEALIYEFQNNTARLVGVEYIVTFDAWHATHELNDPPILDGQLLNLVEEPNRFGLPRFYELHAWAWRDNPNGTFVDWNPLVSCDQR
jgi:hypothetical protein